MTTNQEVFLDNFTVSTTTLDHHGLVAAIYKKLELGEAINKRLKKDDPRRIVSPSDAVLAMILNGLGFTNRRLYLTPQFFQDKPIDRLIGNHLQSKHLDDHALGKALDEIADYGATRLFAEVSFEIGLKHELFGPSAHVDSTSISVQGEYAVCENDLKELQITHGFSKDHRPDLKQLVINLCTSGPSEYPFWMESKNGNNSDKADLPKVIERVKAFKNQLKNAPDLLWIGDSALYSKEGILKNKESFWITRAPETITEVKKLVEQNDSQISWIDLEDGYKFAEYSSNYGDVEQRFILFFSFAAYTRESKTVEKRLIKQQEKLEKELWHLSNQIFGCEKDALKAIGKLQNQYPLFNIDAECVALLNQIGRGRPAFDSEKVVTGYQIIFKVSLNKAAHEHYLLTKGRFVLATNQLDQEKLSAQKILLDYKSQQGIERGFRFLKDPWFMADSIFLKSPKRISALMMVMMLCLLVYNVGQYWLRTKLKQENETLPNQLGKPIQNPTLRWIFQIMEGICIATISLEKTFIKTQTTNLTNLRMKIIQLFGDYALEIYGFS